MSDRLRKRKVDWIVERAYRRGFLSSVYGAIESGLEYSSTSGLYAYNPIRHMAYVAGREDCEAILAERLKPGRFEMSPTDIEVPAEVWAKAYAMGNLALRRSPLRIVSRPLS